ncbi:hypothetical protein C7B72_24010, partial [Bacillus halotolerans]
VSDIAGCEGIVPEDIILVDDNPKYQAPAEAAGYQFLLVSREDDINLVYKDKAYLIQVMRKAGLSDKQILAGIVKNADNRDVRIDLLDIYMKIGPHSTEGFGLAKQIKARDQELQHAYYPKLAVLEHHCVEHGEIL